MTREWAMEFSNIALRESLRHSPSPASHIADAVLAAAEGISDDECRCADEIAAKIRERGKSKQAA